VQRGPIEVRFESGERATLVVGGDGSDPEALLRALGLQPTGPRPVLVVCGGADELEGRELERAKALLGPAVARAADLSGAAIVDGGTASGVMSLVGAAQRDRAPAVSVLLGVAPAGRVALPDADNSAVDKPVELEPHHTHFALADSGEWGGETELLMKLAAALADGAPVAMVVAGGGDVTELEALEGVRRGWPVFLIEGTGGVADDLARLEAAHREPAEIENLTLREIVADGDLRRFSGSEPAQLARQLGWELQDDPVLKGAWRAFATYDALATGLRRGFGRTQVAILVLGIAATAIALLHEALGTAPLHWAAVAGPLVVSTLIAYAGRRAAGKRWVLVRAAAEAIKAEIYRYRTRTGVYNDSLLADEPNARARLLATRLDAIEAGLMQTEASSGVLTPYDGPLPPAMYGAGRDDDGVSRLEPKRYIQIRIADQLAYYHGRTRRLDRIRGLLQLAAVAAGGAGAILAAAGLEIWIGLTTAISAAALSYLASMQVENTIVAYNQSASKLAGLEREWGAGGEGRDAAAFDELVKESEAVLGTELGGWVQQMNEALQKQQHQQAEATRQVQVKRADG
jgi:SLOG in TRPM, prokaryote/SMODS and SLOG-associating 2TM effector domain 1/Protein of unknown function (DUF4231)